MKALLVARRVRPERTQDLTELLAPRYAAGLKLGAEDARAAFAAVERVVAAVRAHLPPRLH